MLVQEIVSKLFSNNPSVSNFDMKKVMPSQNHSSVFFEEAILVLIVFLETANYMASIQMALK